ncbi:hypothetical protein D3C73_1574780 [compost metagenome]
MENTKVKSLEDYLEDVQSKLPGIPTYLLDWLEGAFKTGYNVRKTEEDEALHKTASDQLSK